MYSIKSGVYFVNKRNSRHYSSMALRLLRLLRLHLLSLPAACLPVGRAGRRQFIPQMDIFEHGRIAQIVVLENRFGAVRIDSLFRMLYNIPNLVNIAFNRKVKAIISINPGLPDSPRLVVFFRVK